MGVQRRLGGPQLPRVHDAPHGLAAGRVGMADAAFERIVDLDGKIVPARLFPRLQLQRIGHLSQFHRQLRRLFGERRTQPEKGIALKGKGQAGKAGKVAMGDGAAALFRGGQFFAPGVLVLRLMSRLHSLFGLGRRFFPVPPPKKTGKRKPFQSDGSSFGKAPES